MKKALSMALAVMVFCLFAAASGEEAPVEYTLGDYTYSINADGNAVIEKYSRWNASVSVPSALDGHPVVGIDYFAFCINSLKSITLPDSLAFIDEFAFFGCNSLTSIYLPENVKSIGTAALPVSSLFTYIEVSPDNPVFASIDGVLFRKEDKTLLTYPAGRSGAEYNVPEGIQSIGDYAFRGCSYLGAVFLPDSLRSVGFGAFASCDALTSIEISPDHPVFTTVDGVLFHQENGTLLAYPAGKASAEYAVPQGTRSIEYQAFLGASALTSVVCPDSLLSIGNLAFAFCDALTTVTLPANLQSIGVRAFVDCSSLSSVTLPDTLQSIGENAFANCYALTLTVPRESYALAYAKENGIRYQYTDALDWLNP